MVRSVIQLPLPCLDSHVTQFLFECLILDLIAETRTALCRAFLFCNQLEPIEAACRSHSAVAVEIKARDHPDMR